jgi:hypothetical protein
MRWHDINSTCFAQYLMWKDVTFAMAIHDHGPTREPNAFRGNCIFSQYIANLLPRCCANIDLGEDNLEDQVS